MPNLEKVNNSLQYKLHSVLKIKKLWPQFLEAVGEEISLIYNRDEETKNYNNIYVLLEDGNITLSNKFGYSPNLIIDNSLDFVRRQTESIPFRINRKTTYSGYEINFKMINKYGEIYNLFWDTEKLIKAVRWGTTFENINSLLDLTKPFIGFSADRNFSSINLSDSELMDDSNYLDEEPPLRMDSGSFIYPSKHLAIEYIIDSLINEGGEDFLLTENYFKYLELGTEYNRQVPIVPHNGALLNILTNTSGYYNYNNLSLDYSVPDLKLKSAICSEYIKNVNDPLVAKYNLLDFKYLSVGIGNSYIPKDTDYSILNDFDNMLVYYSTNDEDTSFTIKDRSNNNYDLVLTGDNKKIQGILGKTINFDGITKASIDDVSFDGLNLLTLSFWSKADIAVEPLMTLFSIGFITLSYDSVLEELKLQIDASTFDIPLLISDFTSIGYFNIELSLISNTIKLFRNTVELLSSSIPPFSITGSYSIFLGCNYAQTTFYKGILEDFSIYTKLISSIEKEQIYNNKITLLSKLNRFTYRIPLKEVEKNESLDGLWYGFQSYVKANLVNDEALFSYETGITTYLGKTVYNNLEPFKTKIKYNRKEGSITVNEEVLDNGNGEFENSYISGSIDYDTGDYIINTFSINRDPYKLLSSTPITVLNTAVNPFVELGSFQMLYSIGGSFYSANDDTLGNIVGTAITSGSIDYTTGIISITFSTITDGDVSCTYLFKRTAVIDNGEYITIEYNIKSENGLQISEVGLEDENKNLLVYATFPPIKFNSFNNHLSFGIFVKKTYI